VLGGTGFIGSYIIDELLRRGEYQVYMLGRKFRSERANPKVDAVIQVDMQDYDGMVKALKGVDSVINAAAAIPNVFSTDEDMWRINKDGQLCVLKAAQKTGVKIYILVGSMYPKHPPGDPLAKTWLDSKAAGGNCSDGRLDIDDDVDFKQNFPPPPQPLLGPAQRITLVRLKKFLLCM